MTLSRSAKVGDLMRGSLTKPRCSAGSVIVGHPTSVARVLSPRNKRAALRSCPLLRCLSGDLGYGPPAHAKLIGAGPVAGKVAAVRVRGLDAGKSGRRRGGAGLCARHGSAREDLLDGDQ
jgi:hypothetical protein